MSEPTSIKNLRDLVSPTTLGTFHVEPAAVLSAYDDMKMRAEAAEAMRDDIIAICRGTQLDDAAIHSMRTYVEGKLELEKLAHGRGEELGRCLIALSKAEAERDALRKYLLDLLAVVHRDGGHHTEAVGTRQSVVDAELAVHALRKDAVRLDWMESQKVLRASFYPLCFPPCWVVEASEVTSGETLRVAIDAAMAIQTTTGETHE